MLHAGELKALGYSAGHADSVLRFSYEGDLTPSQGAYFINMVYGSSDPPYIVSYNYGRECEALVEGRSQ